MITCWCGQIDGAGGLSMMAGTAAIGGGMIYDEPVFKTLGDTAINVEFGDETSIPLNFRILALNFALREHAPKGLVETNPQVRTLGLVFDPLATTRARIVAHVKELIAAQDAGLDPAEPAGDHPGVL